MDAMTHRCPILLVTLLLVGLFLTGSPPLAAASTGTDEASRWRTLTGAIDGAEFEIEVPERWNGSLVLYSHGYYPPDAGIPPGIPQANRTETEEWLLDHGYALVASDFAGRYGFVVERAVRDQIAVLDWFGAHVGRPRRTLATGSSMGAVISLLLAQRYPHRIDGVLTMCGLLDPIASWNLTLDLTFTIRMLLAPGQEIDLVSPRDPARSVQALLQAVDHAAATPQGRARLALANAMANVVGWYSAVEPRPASLAGQIAALAALDRDLIVRFWGPTGRVDLEQRAGGNPSWNIGVDYSRQLARSDRAELVRRAYREAHIDLQSDLSRLAAAQRITPDANAVAYLYRTATPSGATTAPVLTLHNTGDGLVVADNERWYAGQVRRSGDRRLLRQVYVDRGNHCAFTAAEEIVAFNTLVGRIDIGYWPSIEPDRLNRAATAFGTAYHTVFDLATWQEATVPPAFAHFTPPAPLRPSG